MHIRRAAWPDDQWIIDWRGLWFLSSAGIITPVRAGDYSADDLQATDWTTVPAPLAACPIDPTIGSTGGGEPTPGTGGFPSDRSAPPTDPVYAAAPGLPSGGGPPYLPPPSPGTGVTVTFAGISSPDAGGDTEVNLNQSFMFPATGGTQTFASGKDAALSPIYWDVSVARIGSLWTASISAHIPGDPSGGFSTASAQRFAVPIENAFTSGTYAYGGTATVH